MLSNYLRALFFLIMTVPLFSKAQDTTMAKKDTMAKTAMHDSTAKPKDTTAINNCYKDWLEAFAARGAKPVPDGMQDVVIAFKMAENFNCFLGRVEVVGGKIKPPLYVQTENGEYKTFASIGKKLDPDFAAASGESLYKITDGMSVLFKTMDNEYGRIFFYKFVSKGAQTNKKAPSPTDLIKD